MPVTSLILVPRLLNLNWYHNFSHLLSHLITPYHTLTPVFDRAVRSMTNLDLAPRLLKCYHILPHFITSEHTFSHFIPNL